MRILSEAPFKKMRPWYEINNIEDEMRAFWVTTEIMRRTYDHILWIITFHLYLLPLLVLFHHV